MKLSSIEESNFYSYITDYITSEWVNEMKHYIQHGRTTTYKHCVSVAYYSYWLSLRLHLNCDLSSLARGSMLHDFYLYDWHVQDKSHRLHGFSHPKVALANAKKHFKLNHIEEDIIKKHMWPLNITKLPRYRESVIVCIVDKLCSAAEILRIKIYN